ncbi:hypothetical protein CDL12_06769 [Handroanthus impetiginosus]|uniref:Knottin scorpion toxin-like domain-containing protein n=1 Tax=Handroanthus impetiginosus TaxID=429701 RepID=A0A2G9HSN8_9LAMI|nr:hypothetical protein CDL12_06769 [Handroanthus impetiginosus]
MASAKFLPLFLIVLFVLSIGNNHVEALKCCFDNHIGSCNPGQDDPKCNTLCKENCTKGGFCKVFNHKPPNHYCHCYC